MKQLAEEFDEEHNISAQTLINSGIFLLAIYEGESESSVIGFITLLIDMIDYTLIEMATFLRYNGILKKPILLFCMSALQGSHGHWKTWKMAIKNPCMENSWNLKNDEISWKNHGILL